MRKKRISEFFKKEHRKLLAFVQRKIDDAAERDAEDIIQDVMLNLIDRADPTQAIENLSAYIYRAVKNRIVDAFRRRRGHISLDEELPNGNGGSLEDLVQDMGDDAAARQERAELHHLLYAAIASLDDKDRAIITATEFEGYSFKELSEKWDVPMGTLLARKSRALDKIKGMLRHALP